jgi:hypothetical protein
MGMWDFEFGGQTAEEFERTVGPLPSGHYRFKFVATATNQQDGSQELRCQVTYGPFAGRVHIQYLKSPLMAHSAEAGAMDAKKAIVYLKRFGVVPREAKSCNNPDWSKIVGQEGVMKMEHRTWPAKPENPETGQKAVAAGERTEIAIGGVWPMDHPEVATFKPDVLAAIGLGPAVATTARTTANSPTAPAGGGAPPVPAGVTPSQELAKKLWD